MSYFLFKTTPIRCVISIERVSSETVGGQLKQKKQYFVSVYAKDIHPQKWLRALKILRLLYAERTYVGFYAIHVGEQHVGAT